MKKMLVITLVLVILVASLSGCVKSSVQPGPDTPDPTPTEAQDTPLNPEPASKIADNGVDIKGKLNGWIDGNSVEIEINSEDTLAFRVTGVIDQLEGIEDGDTVKFSYEANENGQLIITKIEKAE